MLTGTCQSCGTTYWGWALSQEQHHTCPECGSLIRVMEYGKGEKQNSIWEERAAIEKRTSVGEPKKSANKAFKNVGVTFIMTGQDDCMNNAEKAQKKEQKEKILAPVRYHKHTDEELPAGKDRHKPFEIPRRWHIY